MTSEQVIERQQRLRVVPVELSVANRFITRFHRHHQPVIGHRFSIGCVNEDNVLVGVCVVGRPVARMAGSPGKVLEVNRVATSMAARLLLVSTGQARASVSVRS